MSRHFRKQQQPVRRSPRAITRSVLALALGGLWLTGAAQAAGVPPGDTHYALTFYDGANPSQIDGLGDFWVGPVDVLGNGNQKVDLITAALDPVFIPVCATADCHFNTPTGVAGEFIPGERAFTSNAGGARHR